MRGTVAKLLRRTAKRTMGESGSTIRYKLPEHNTRNSENKLRMGKIIRLDGDDIRTFPTIILDPLCWRGYYQQLKGRPRCYS